MLIVEYVVAVVVGEDVVESGIDDVLIVEDVVAVVVGADFVVDTIGNSEDVDG